MEMFSESLEDALVSYKATYTVDIIFLYFGPSIVHLCKWQATTYILSNAYFYRPSLVMAARPILLPLGYYPFISHPKG